nr:AAA family ATPase [Planctomonas sp. JC2975]
MAPDEQAEKELQRLRSRNWAERKYRAEQAEAVAIPTAVTLDELLQQDLPEEPFVIDGLLHDGGNVMFSAQKKAGKTTVTHNLIRSLVDGEPFLGRFTTTSTRRVAVLDLELSPTNIQRWLSRQGIAHPERVGIFSLRGAAASLNIIDAHVRAEWAKRLQGYDTLILDPLRPLLDALGLNEHTEAGVILQAFDALKTEAGIKDGIVVHHHGHGSEHARGDSRLEDWPDAIWRLTRDDPTDPRAWRYFDAFGRDVDVEKGLVTMDDRGHLSFSAEMQAMKADRLVQLACDALAKHGEMKTSEIVALGLRGISKNTVSDVMKSAVDCGQVVIREGERNSRHYSLSPSL